LLEKLAERRAALALEIDEAGKIAEFKWRKNNHSRQLNRSNLRQRILGKIGWAEKKDIEELNRKLALISLMLEEKSKSGGVTSNSALERRRIERRKMEVTQNYDKRIYNRREQDREAA